MILKIIEIDLKQSADFIVKIGLLDVLWILGYIYHKPDLNTDQNASNHQENWLFFLKYSFK